MKNNNFSWRELGKKAGHEFKQNFKTKSVGAYLTAACWVLGIVALFIYVSHSNIVASDPESNYALFTDPAAIACGIVALILPIPLCMFRQSAPLVPMVQIVCSIVPLLGYAMNPSSDLIDYIGTIFIDGFSAGKLFGAIPPTVLAGMILYLIIFVVSTVAFYLPQNREPAIPVAQEGCEE